MNCVETTKQQTKSKKWIAFSNNAPLMKWFQNKQHASHVQTTRNHWLTEGIVDLTIVTSGSSFCLMARARIAAIILGHLMMGKAAYQNHVRLSKSFSKTVPANTVAPTRVPKVMESNADQMSAPLDKS